MESGADCPPTNENEKAPEWLPITEIPQRGYWFGVESVGFPYRNRLCLNVDMMEKIFKGSKLPPIFFRAENWNPPAIADIDQVGETAVMKKVALGTQRRGEFSSKSAGLVIETSKEKDLVEDVSVPIGWNVGLQARGFLFHHETENPVEKKEQTEKIYVDFLDKALRSSIARVALLEALNMRMEDGVDRITIPIVKITFGDCAPFAPAIVGYSLTQELTGVAKKGADRLLQILTSWGASRGMTLKAYEKMNQDFFLNQIEPDKIATAEWRKANFPELHLAETKQSNISPWDTFKFLPFALLFGPVYQTAFSLTSNSQSLVKLKQ